MKKSICVLVILTILMLISNPFVNIAYAAPIEGNPNWDIHFENIQISEGSVTALNVPTIDDTLTEINYGINLDTPGQFYEFTVDVKNSGSIDAMLEEVLSTILTTEQQRYLLYSVTYDTGATIAKNDKLNSGASEKVKVRIEFKRDITAEDLPNRDTTLELTLSMRYVQADENAHDVEDPDNPDTPEDPDKPGNNPDNPENPDKPVNPDKPDSPEDPDKPGNPENSDKPGESDKTDNSGKTDKPNNSEDNSGKSEDSNKNTEKESTSNPKSVQTGDNIVIYFIILAFAAVVLIVVLNLKKDEEKE